MRLLVDCTDNVPALIHWRMSERTVDQLGRDACATSTRDHFTFAADQQGLPVC